MEDVRKKEEREFEDTLNHISYGEPLYKETIENSPSPTDEETKRIPYSGKVKIVNAAYVRLRAKPKKNAPVVGFVHKGDVVTIVPHEIHTSSDGTKYYQIKTIQGKLGYLPVEYTKEV